MRVTVKDDSIVASDDDWKAYLQAVGVVHGNNSLQVIYGVQVQNIATKVKDILNID